MGSVGRHSDFERSFLPSVERMKGAREEMLRLNEGDRRVPTLLLPDGSVLVDPTSPELNARLNDQAV